MNEQKRDDRVRAEEPTPQDGPKGFYRKADPYDPFNSGEAGEEEKADPRQRRRKSRRNWRTMKPRPRESVEVVETRSYWLIALALAGGFLLGFVVRTLMIPHETAPRIPFVETPGTTVLDHKPDLEEMERQTRKSIQALNQKVQDNAMSRSPPGIQAERMSLKFGEPKAETPAMLKLKPNSP